MRAERTRGGSMPLEATITRTDLDGLRLLHRGKVRDLYDLGENLLIVATDRVSAYDCVLSPGIPDKGRVLTSMSVFWFDVLQQRLGKDVAGNHLVTADVDRMPEVVRRHADALRGRAMLVRRLEMVPVECVARGYLTGSGWKDYRRTGAVCGHALPAGLPESARLEPPIFTPATKAEVGHDENIDFAAAARLVGDTTARQLRERTLAIYGAARDIAAKSGILIADTKFEFGRDASGRLVIGDEVLTPDSSRFWNAAAYEPGRPQQAFDKQMIRDWLDARGWDHTPPAPVLPPDVVERAAATYRDIHRRLTGRELA
jgi:phosphoribosylaminoimidazole-succinocarboxamide synthase